MVIVIALTTLLQPFIMKWFYGRYSDHLPSEAAATLPPDRPGVSEPTRQDNPE